MEQINSIGELVRKQEDDFIHGTTQISKYVAFSMHDTLEKVDAYINSVHITGETDSLGRDKPFFNIVTAAEHIWFRATDIDRKNIKFVPKNNKSVVLAFVANIILQNWMRDERFGVFLNSWGRTLARYGSAVPKFVKNSTGLHASITPWNRLIVDAVNFEANPKIEVLELTEAELRGRIKTHNYDKDQVDALCDSLSVRVTLDKNRKDNKSGYIKLYEVHGNLPQSYLTNKETDEDTYVQQMHVISFVGKRTGRKMEYEDFTLYCGEEANDPYRITHLIEEEGRSLAIGAVEHLFQAQWMTNHSMKTIKDTLDISSRLIFQTSDTHFVGRNVLAEIESGDILTHVNNMPLTKVDTSKADIVSMQNYALLWKNVAQEQTATPDSMRGQNAPSGTPYASTAMLTEQANSLFELMTENKGLAIEDMMTDFVTPYIKQTLKHKDEVVAILDQAGIQEIDNIYIPNEAIKRFNKRAAAQIYANVDTLAAGGQPTPVQPFNAAHEQQNIQQQMATQGDKRFFVPSDADDKTWADVFSDFEWDNVMVEVTNEQVDKAATLQTLNTVLTTIASNPMILSNPNAMTILAAILNQTGVISPIQLTTSNVLPPPMPHTMLRENVDFKDLPPEAKTQLLEKMGIQLQPQQPAGSNGGALPTNK